VGNKIVVPADKTLRADIIQAHHTPKYAGHKGRKKTHAAIKHTFWWPRLHIDVNHFVNTCDACQRNKHSTLRPAGLLQPLQLPARRWEHVSIDFITHLPKTSRQHDAILVFMDKLSKYVRFAPTTMDISATGAAHLFLDKVVSLFGLPKKLITDRDPRFTGNMSQAFCTMFGVQSALSTSFHPQTDGQTENLYFCFGRCHHALHLTRLNQLG